MSQRILAWMMPVLIPALHTAWAGDLQELERLTRTVATVPPDGMVVYKLHRQDDEFAPVVEYANIKLFPTVANMTTMAGRFFSLQRPQMVYQIDYPSPNADLFSETDYTELQARIIEYQHVSKQFKRAAPLLAPWIARFKQEQKMWQQGLGRAEGRWIENRTDYEFERQRAIIRQEFAARRAKILGEPVKIKDEPEPLWAVDLELMEKLEQEKFREEYRKKVLAARRERTEKFHDSVVGLSPKTPNKLKRRSGLNTAGGLDRAGGLDSAGSLTGR